MSDTAIVPAEDTWIVPFASWVTPRGLRELPDDLSFEDWAKLGLYIGTVFTASKWALGDWLNFGEHRFGEKFAQAAEATGRSEQGLMNIASTCKAFAPEYRQREVPFGLFEETAKIARDDPEEADSILARAEVEKMTREELRAELRPAVVTKPTLTRLTVDEIEERFEQWKSDGHYNEYRTRGGAMMAAFLDWLRE